MGDQRVIDAYLGAHHDVDLGAAEGIEVLEHQLAQDKESVFGTPGEDILGRGITEQDGRDPNADEGRDRKDAP